MKLAKKVLFVSTLLVGGVLAGCQSQPSVLTFSTPSPTATFNTNNQTALVNVATRDLRSSTEVAKYTKNGELRRLTAAPEATQMFQQVMQQNLNSKGFTVVQGAGNANVTVGVKKFFADVGQGNLRYKVSADVAVEVTVQGNKGVFTKNFAANRGYEGAFGANNDEIQKVLAQAYESVVKEIYNDNEIGNAIHQYK